jgi:hypothetical protein
MSIQVYSEKIKGFFASETGKDVSIVAIILLVAFSSFGLGRLSKNESPDVSVEGISAKAGEAAAITAILPEPAYVPAQVKVPSDTPSVSTTTGNFVASKRGKKYYSISCTGAKNLLEANKIYFATKAQAEQAGYTKSASCPDL